MIKNFKILIDKFQATSKFINRKHRAFKIHKEKHRLIYRILIYVIIIIWFTNKVIADFLYSIWNYPENYVATNFKEHKLDQFKFIADKREKYAVVLFAIIGIYLSWRRTKALDEQNRQGENANKISLKSYEALVKKTEDENANNEANLKLQRDKFDKEREALVKKIETEKANNEANLNLQRDKFDKERDVSDKNLILQQFSKASELLASDKIASRLSGIYLFEKIMNSSEDYHWQIIELLTAYVREKSSRYNKDWIISEKSRERVNKEYLPYSFGEDQESFTFHQFEEINLGDDPISETECLIESVSYKKNAIRKDIQAILTVL